MHHRIPVGSTNMHLTAMCCRCGGNTSSARVRTSTTRTQECRISQPTNSRGQARDTYGWWSFIPQVSAISSTPSCDQDAHESKAHIAGWGLFAKYVQLQLKLHVVMRVARSSLVAAATLSLAAGVSSPSRSASAAPLEPADAPYFPTAVATCQCPSSCS